MADQQLGDPDPAAELPDTRVDGGRGQPTAHAPSRWSGAAAVPPRGPRRRWWSRRRARPEPLEHTAVDPDDWASIPAVDPWAGQDTAWNDLPTVTEVPLPPTAIQPPTAVSPPQPARPAGQAAVPPRQPTVGWRERWAREREPLEREVRERAARQREVLQRVARVGAAQVRESMARAAESAPPLLSRLPARPAEPGAGRTAPAWPGATTAPPGAPRPANRPPPPPPPLGPRRRRRRLIRFALMVLVLGVCVPFAYERIPAARQYPVTADLPKSVSDLTLRGDNAGEQAAERLASELGIGDAEADRIFSGVYGDSRGKRVTVVGVTGWRFTPGNDAHARLERLAGDFAIDTVSTFDLGEAGAHEVCGTGRTGGSGVVVCIWADHGSLAAVLLTRRSLDESADLVGRLRGEVLIRG